MYQVHKHIIIFSHTIPPVTLVGRNLYFYTMNGEETVLLIEHRTLSQPKDAETRERVSSAYSSLLLTQRRQQQRIPVW